MTDSLTKDQQVSVAEQVEIANARLADAQDKFQKQLADLRAEKDFYVAELGKAKSDCSLVGTRLDDAVVRASRAQASEAALRKQMDDLEKDYREKMEQLRERQCDAPAIDEAIFKNYRDLRAMLHERCGAEFMTVHEQWAFARSTPLAVLERTREWMLKFSECFQLVMLQVEAQRTQAKKEKAELIGALDLATGGQGNAALLSNVLAAAAAAAGGGAGGDGSNSNTAAAAAAVAKLFGAGGGNGAGAGLLQQQSSSSSGGGGGGMVATSVASAERKKEKQAAADAETIDQLNQRINVLRREAAQTKSELLRAHKNVHHAEQKQYRLQQMLEKAHKQLSEAIEASSSSTVRKQVDEVKRTMRVAISAKDEEISALKQAFEKDVVALTRQINSLNERLGQGDRIHAQLAVQKQENAALKNQLARMDVKSMQDHKKRADRELMELRSHTTNLEATVDQLKLRLSASKQLASESKQKYSALFDAHLQEAKQRQTDAAKARMLRIRREVVGSDSALTKYHFEQKYQALASELANTQQKLKRLIMIAHHDQVAHDAEIEQMQMQAVAYYEKQQKEAENREELSVIRSAQQQQHQQGNDSGYDGGLGQSPAMSAVAASRHPSVGGGGRRQSSVDRNLFSTTGEIRQQLQHNVIVSPGKAVVEEMSRVVGEGKVQDTRSWQPSVAGGFEVSQRTGSAAAVAKHKSDLTEYHNEREKAEALKNQKKVTLSTHGATAPLGSLAGGVGARAATPDLQSSRPPKSAGATGASAASSASPSSVQFFVSGAQTPMGVRERRVQ